MSALTNYRRWRFGVGREGPWYLVSRDAPVFARAPSIGAQSADAERVVHDEVEMELVLELEDLGKGSNVAAAVVEALDDDELAVDLLLLGGVVLLDLLEHPSQVLHVVVLEIGHLAAREQRAHLNGMRYALVAARHVVPDTSVSDTAALAVVMVVEGAYQMMAS